MTDRTPMLPYLLTDERLAEYTIDRSDPPIIGTFFGLPVVYVWNTNEGFSFVTCSDLEKLGVGLADIPRIAADDLAEHARDNLQFEKRGSVFCAFMGGNFEASMIFVNRLWDEFLREMLPNGCIAAIPANDMLAFCEPESVDGVAELKATVQRTFNGGEDLLTEFLFQRINGEWHPYVDNGRKI